jgi:hypothetical protein
MANIINVICVYYNFCKYNTRKQLTLEYIDRMNKTPKVNLYIVELILETEIFEITDANNKNHLQIKTKYMLWFKENLINIAVNKLLDKDWTHFAWIDSDVIFENNNWIDETLHKIQHYDILQLFSHAHYYDKYMNINCIKIGCIYKQYNGIIAGAGPGHGHPGLAWAISRNCYEKINKLPELFIVGGGDSRIKYGIFNRDKIVNKYEDENEIFHEEFKNYILKLPIVFDNVTINYIDCNIYHFYHGSHKNRKYFDRYKLLSKYKYNPFNDIKYNNFGLIEPSESFNPKLLLDIEEYFKERLEDD